MTSQSALSVCVLAQCINIYFEFGIDQSSKDNFCYQNLKLHRKSAGPVFRKFLKTGQW